LKRIFRIALDSILILLFLLIIWQYDLVKYGIMQGKGNVARHIVLPSPYALDEPAIQALITEALARAKVPLGSDTSHRIIIKSISAKQRQRRPIEAAVKPKSRSRAVKR